MRVAAGGRTDVVPTTVRGPSLNGIANKGGRLREVGVFNTTTTAVAVALVRATAAGTIGTAMTEIILDAAVNTSTPQLVVANTHTANATVTAPVRQATLGAAAGAGVIWTFGDEGFVITPGTANGVVIICPTGTAQHLDFYFEWEE